MCYHRESEEPFTFDTFEVFSDDEGWQDNLSGQVAVALTEKSSWTFTNSPSIEEIEVIGPKSITGSLLDPSKNQ